MIRINESTAKFESAEEMRLVDLRNDLLDIGYSFAEAVERIEAKQGRIEDELLRAYLLDQHDNRIREFVHADDYQTGEPNAAYLLDVLDGIAARIETYTDMLADDSLRHEHDMYEAARADLIAERGIVLDTLRRADVDPEWIDNVLCQYRSGRQA